MRKIDGKVKLGILTNAVLLVLIIGVFALSFFPRSAYPIFGKSDSKVYYHGNRDKNHISLMFNVYQNTDVVNGILDLLKEREVKATFFLGGVWADKNADTVSRIALEGHEIGNHGYFHKDHDRISLDKNKEEILVTEKLIESYTGIKTALFAPPSGAYNNTTIKACEELGYKVIMWTDGKDTIDWRDKDEELAFTRATKNAAGGDMVLMHPMQHTLNALNRILDRYAEIGLKPVTVSENIL